MKRNTILIVLLILIVIGTLFASKKYHFLSKDRQTEISVISTGKNSKDGTFLTNSQGKTLYINIINPTVESVCDFHCLSYYKPYIAIIAYSKEKDFQSNKYLFNDKITVIKRSDGLYQYAYEGKLLYSFTGDIKPGDVNGLELFGKKDWDIIKLQ